jgi:hypothetical protein
VVRRVLPLLLVALLAACGDGSTRVVATTTTTVARPVPVTAAVDWAARTIEVDGDIAFDVNFCDGDAPFLCGTDDGAMLGSIELAAYPEVVDDFDAWATRFYDAMAADRVAACPGYTLDGDDPVDVTFGGLPAVRYGFTGSVGGSPVERVIGYAANDGSTLRLLVANALSDDGCLHRESELPITAMDDRAPILAAVATGSRF